jgi:abnormal spindle-like microcephaly-associated protein
MSRQSITTPCPAPSRLFDDIPAFDDQDDTSQIEYTRVIQREFAHARPRRPGKRDIAPKVFEDVPEEDEVHQVGNRAQAGRRGMLLGKRPTKRVPMGGVTPQGRASIAPMNTHREQPISPKHDEPIADNVKRDSRRRNIYIPSDDTTMMTIHPGANTTNRLDDTFQLPTYQPQSLLDCISHSPPSGEEIQHRSPAKKPRMSLAAAPRRVPLEQMEAKSLNAPTLDLMGEGGGKENSPPGFMIGEKGALKSVAAKLAEPARPSVARSRLLESTAASQLRQTIQSRKAAPLPRTKLSPRAPTVTSAPKPFLTRSREISKTVKPQSPAERRAKEFSPRTRAPAHPKPWQKSANFVSASDASKARIQRYQVLTEDVSRPDLYEDNWLDQQEVALTEVVNQIFADAQPRALSTSADKESIRISLLEIYDQPHVAMLHKRLQASLCYGALSKPKEMLSPPDLTQDLGLRRRFVQLWVESYKLETLCAAAEVIVGRKLPTSTNESPSTKTSSAIDPKESRRALIGFLETFFVTVDDIEHDHGSREDTQMQRRNKTVLRSLMLVWLLDQAAMSRDQPLLFKVKSAHKTSASVLNALAGMLTPSVGDVSRTLKHMDYVLAYSQDPLDEVIYRIDNLAVDLRDGIMLTRLVELLLYRTSSNVWDRLNTADETVTIVLPDATVLQSALYAEDGSHQGRVLVQHLKMPCIGHAQKMYNVDIALQALAGHHRTADLIGVSISAETIVDGHRENTLNLLWSLVSSIGLDVLLDKKALVNDIHRFDATSQELESQPTDALLQKWAAAYCSPSGIQVSNLTTSFASGKPYAAIVAAFSSFFTPADSRSPHESTTTATRLRSMGCSEAFIKQLTSTTTSIPTRQTTLANLAFLASRLLPLAKRHHAAATIQRAFRAKQNRTIVHQRVVLMRLATDCAKVVRDQQRFVDAAMLVQRTWRAIVSSRVERLEGDVVDFQVLARGWLERRRVCAAKKRGANGAFGRRVGGW